MKHILLRNGEGYYNYSVHNYTELTYRASPSRRFIETRRIMKHFTTEDTSDGLDCNSYSTPTSRANTPDWNGKSCKSCATTLQIHLSYAVVPYTSLADNFAQLCEGISQDNYIY